MEGLLALGVPFACKSMLVTIFLELYFLDKVNATLTVLLFSSRVLLRKGPVLSLFKLQRFSYDCR